MDDILVKFIVFGVFAYSCILHECGHVWVALKLGDPTGKMEGRLTLNPLPHIDPFWTVILPILTLVTTGFPIGGPKPAPVNPLNFQNPRVGSMWTALAGPGTNLALALAAFVLLWFLRLALPEFVDRAHIDVRGEVVQDSFNYLFFRSVMQINMFLMALNLIPVPPLDGSRFLRFLLGPASDRILDSIERLGFIPIFIAFYFLGNHAVRPFLALVDMMLALIYRQK